MTDAIPITVISRKVTCRGEFIVWSDGQASRHWFGGEEWCSVEEAERAGEQGSLFAEATT
jgi:hypothetical protein